MYRVAVIIIRSRRREWGDGGLGDIFDGGSSGRRDSVGVGRRRRRFDRFVERKSDSAVASCGKGDEDSVINRGGKSIS